MSDFIPGVKTDTVRMLIHPAVTQHSQMAQVTLCSGFYVLHTSSSSFAEDRDLRLDLRLWGGFPFVCLCDFVNIWLLPGHFLHESLWRGRKSVPSACYPNFCTTMELSAVFLHLVLLYQAFDLLYLLWQRLLVLVV